MKIELKEERKRKIDKIETHYYTEVDGEFVYGSLFFDLENAEKIYQQICENKGILSLKEIETLKTYIL
jgi:hypothetical protein